MDAVSVESLTVRLGDTVVLRDLHLRIPYPSLTFVIGPNGGGKSTFLKALIGLVPYSGRISIFGLDPQRARQEGRISYLPQETPVVPPLAGGDLGHPFGFLPALSPGRRRRALLEMVLREGDLILLDEPESYLDPSAKAWLWQRVRDVARERTVLVVSHDVSAVLEDADQVICLNQEAHLHPDEGFLTCAPFHYPERRKWVDHREKHA